MQSYRSDSHRLTDGYRSRSATCDHLDMSNDGLMVRSNLTHPSTLNAKNSGGVLR